MNILVVDAQGGGIGRQLVSALRRENADAVITAVGTNSTATSAMLREGADHVATGENAVIVGARGADIIAGPVGIVIADSLFGEITPAMATAIGQSRAKRVLLPVSHCDNIVAGVPETPVAALVQDAVAKICALCATRPSTSGTCPF